MDSATTFAWVVAIGASIWFLAVSVARQAGRVGAFVVGRTPRTWAAVVALVVVAGMVRPVVSDAVTPPPSMRVVTVEGPYASRHVLGETIKPYLAVAYDVPPYTVTPGDSLWEIARSLLVDLFDPPTGEQITSLWQEIYAMNREVIGNDPNLILPGQVLSIPGGNRG